MKVFLEVLFTTVIILFLLYLFFHSATVLLAPSTPQSVENKVCFARHCFSVELAKTEAERDKGLMSRSQLDKGNGMFFIFDKEGVYPFWMKNTLIPLDIIWINSDNKVVFIGHDIQPCKTFICPTTNPLVKAKYVLEINGGIAKEIGLAIGDRADVSIK